MAILSLCSFTKLSPASADRLIRYHTQGNDYFSGGFYNDCTQEFLSGEGYVVLMYSSVYDPTTNTGTGKLRVNYTGITFRGETTGKTYKITSYTEKVSETFDGCTYYDTYTDTYKINTAGSKNNFYYTVQYTYTYNECTGEYNDTQDFVSSSCG